MKAFLKENWIWIVAPIVLVLGVVLLIVLNTEADPGAPFVYNVH